MNPAAASETLELNYNSAASLRSFLDANGLGMRKKYGQHFLLNPAVRTALVDALRARAGETVWEIGPGLGAMTRQLLDQGLHVRAFEIDSGFAAALRRIFAADAGFTLREGDALKTWRQEEAHPCAPLYLLGNLPYNIAAALLADFIEQGRFFKRIVVTVQREVARRMAARPGSADYSSFSVLCASAYTVQPLMVIHGASFYPRPAVDSQAVLLEPRTDRAAAAPPILYPLVRGLFASRRKKIKNNLTAFIARRSTRAGRPTEIAASALEQAGLHGDERAETLSLEAFLSLARAVAALG